MASRSGSRQAALVRARERRRELDRDRDAQDERIEEATAEALTALDARGEAQEAVAAASTQLGAAIRKLLAEDVTADQWARPYGRELAAFPVEALRRAKYWPPVSRIDGGYGDRNLMCSCPPPSAYAD